MTPQEYIQQQLQNIKDFHPREIPQEELANEIFRLLMSKKFRKYSANAELIQHIKDAIKINIENNQPINVTFPHGAYKLWRLEEAPLPDWAELFASMHYTAWLKPICEIYKPGVWFDYFVDDLIVPIIDNIPMDEIKQYIHEEQKILDFLKPYQPKNLKMTITPFETLFPSPEKFESLLQEKVAKFAKTNPTFTEDQLKVVELNTKPTKEQLKDPLWREKVLLIHDTYLPMKREIGYYYQPHKIPIFCLPLPSGKFLIVGTTKTSVAKFWVGVGVLKKEGDSYKEYILSPKQLAEATYEKETISLPGLEGKNFHTIRIVNS